MTEDEVIDIISDVTTLLGTALAQCVELNESAGAGIESQKLKLDALKARLADEKLKLAKLKDAAKRKMELAKANQHQPLANESKSSSSPMLTSRDATGKAVGFVRVMKKRTDYFSPTGKLVAREIGGMTYDFSRGGKLASRDRQGMRVLGGMRPLIRLGLGRHHPDPQPDRAGRHCSHCGASGRRNDPRGRRSQHGGRWRGYQAGRAVDPENRVGNPPQAGKAGGMKRKKSLPSVSKSEVESLPKTEAVLLRLTTQDKATIGKAASKLHLTVTEFLTKSALMVAEKVRP